MYPPHPKVRPVNVFSRLRRENVYKCHWNLSILYKFTRYSVNHWQQKWIIIRCLLTINKIWKLPGIWNQSNLHLSSPSTGCIYCWRHRKLGQVHCFSRLMFKVNFEPLFSKFGQETKKLQQKMCWILILNQAPVHLLTIHWLPFQDFRHFCTKIHKDHYIFENDFINMFGLIHTHCNTSHLHRNVNNLGQSTGKLLLPFILI